MILTIVMMTMITKSSLWFVLVKCYSTPDDNNDYDNEYDNDDHQDEEDILMTNDDKELCWSDVTWSYYDYDDNDDDYNNDIIIIIVTDTSWSS